MSVAPKRHHFLPQNYLDGFARDWLVWVYDRELKTLRGQQPVNTAVRTHFYSHIGDNGTKNAAVESQLLSQIDGWFPPLRDWLLNRGQLGWNDRLAMAYFVSLLYCRVPAFADQVEELVRRTTELVADVAFSSEKSTDAALRQFERDTGKKRTVSAEELHDFHAGGRYEITVSRNPGIRVMLELFQKIANLIVHMQWTVVHAVDPRTSFITCDNPFLVVPPLGATRAGLMTKGALKLVPLHQSMVLSIGDICDAPEDSIHVEEKSRSTIRDLNRDIAHISTRFVIGRDEALVKRVVESLN